jgi:diguanylate cyclase (GGDEF)-like protein/PAS domain S-box-containing protein
MNPSVSTNGTHQAAAHDPAPPSSARPERLDTEEIERSFMALVERYPEAAVAAFNETGTFQQMPASVPLERNPLVKGGSGLEAVPPEDRETLISTFLKIIEHGTGECVLHSLDGFEIQYYGHDLRENHGVIVTLFYRTDDPHSEDSTYETPDLPPERPRLATIRKSENSFILGIDDATTQILGWTPEEMVGRLSTEFIHPDEHSLAVDSWFEMRARPGPSRRFRQRLRHKDGRWVWFEVTNHNLLEDPDHRCVSCEMVDITDEMAAQELLNRIAEAIPVGLFQIDLEGAIVYTNDRLHEILGVERAGTVEEQLTTIIPADRPVLVQAIAEVLVVGSHSDIEVNCRPPGSSDLRACTISFRALTDEEGTITGAIACVADVTESVRMREELKYRATFDELTGCHNRASIMAALESDIARDRRRAERAVMFLDLDGFKVINDRDGHAAGDELLRNVARLLQEAVRKRDLVGRIGGDEFLVICPDVGGSDEAMALADRLVGELRTGLSAVDDGATCKVSIGVAWSSGNKVSAEALVAGADNAMYDSKREGAGRPKLG